MQALPPLPPPPPPPPPASTQGGGASEWCKAAVMEAQQPGSSVAAASSYGYPYNQYASYSTYAYSQQTQTPQTTGTAQATANGSTAQPPPPPPPPSTKEEQERQAAWARYAQLQQQMFYPHHAYAANPQGAYAAANPQAAYQYQYGAYAGYSYPAYPTASYNHYQQPQQQAQAALPPLPPPAPSSASTTAQRAGTGSQLTVSSTVTDPRLKQQTTTTRPKVSRFSAAKLAAAPAPASDAMDIDDEGPVVSQKNPAVGSNDPSKNPALKNWLERCLFQVRNNPVGEARLRGLLLAKVQECQAMETIGTTDWAREPLIAPPSPEPSPRSVGSSSRWDTDKRRKRRGEEDSEDGSGSEREADARLGRYGPAGGGKGPGGKKQQQQKGKKQPQQKKAKREVEQQQQSAAKDKKAIAQYEHDELANLRRLQRFRADAKLQPKRSRAVEVYEDDGEGFDPTKVKPVRGTCQELEKEYFRLNEVPAPEVVRPEPVLRRALAKLKRRFVETPEADREADYHAYLWTQLKAIRQDLLVQHLRNDLVIDVYETHARIALECRDLNEYNQCQTQLMEHYRDGLQGSVFEFHAYRLLYYVYLQSNPKYQEGDMGFIRILGELTPQDLAEPAVAHALKVRKAVALGNYHALGRLYLSAPNMGAYIMDHFMDQARIKALQTMVKGYRPTISRDFVQQELAFTDEATCLEFLKKVGVQFTDETEKLIDTKQTKVDPSGLARRALM